MAKDSARTNLPIPDPDYTGLVTYDARDPESHFPPIEPLRPPAGAPNVLLIMLDDLGFGAASAFGGPCAAPVMERLAARGLRYTRFHTTALCAPTRASLLTGRNPHSVGFGSVPEIATSAPGYSTVRPKSAAPLPEVLKLNGYSTAQFGKCHEVPLWQTSPVGPFDMWPTGSGFEHFYGFIGGETNQYYPALYEGTTPVEPPKTPQEGYHLTEDLADRAIAWVRQQQSLTPDKPFFMYFAPGATHAPHHVPKQWADRYQGRFDQGWDVLREQTLARQKELGVVPPETVKNRSHSVTAEVQIPTSAGQGVIVAQGGSFGGWALYLTGGRLTYCHNLLGLKRFKVAAGQPVPDGTHQVRMESDYDGGGLGQGATIRLYIDGGQVGEGRLPATVPLIFSVDETADTGCDPATPVSDDYTSRTSAFTGTVNWVQIDLGAFDADHFISPEEQFRIAMARQ